MNVYSAICNEGYEGGCYIIAPNNLDEAKEIASEHFYANIFKHETELQTTKTTSGIICGKIFIA